MTQTAQTLLAMLRDDLARQDDQWRDEGFTQEMYRALTNRIWRNDGVAEAHVSISWQLVDDMLKEIRAAAGEEPLDLDSSGGEGELSRRMEPAHGGDGVALGAAQHLTTRSRARRRAAREAAAA